MNNITKDTNTLIDRVDPVIVVEPYLPEKEHWDEVERVLYFEQTYIKGQHRFDEPAVLIAIYLEQQATGVNNAEIARKYGIVRSSVSYMNAGIDRISSLLLGIEVEQTEVQKRSFEIYQTFNNLISLFDESKNLNTELGILLMGNPEMEDLFRYLATGKRLYDYSLMHGLNMSKSNCETMAESFVGVLINNKYDGRTFETLIRNKIFNQYLTNQTNVYGIDVLSQMHEFSLKALNQSVKNNPKGTSFVCYLKGFFQLAVLTDYFMSKQNSTINNIDNPYEIGIDKYLWHYFNKGKIPYGIQTLLEIIMNPHKTEYYNFLKQNHIHYTPSSLKNIFLAGSKFIENILLMPNEDKEHAYIFNLEYLMTSRHAQAKRIMQLIKENRQNTLHADNN